MNRLPARRCGFPSRSAYSPVVPRHPSFGIVCWATLICSGCDSWGDARARLDASNLLVRASLESGRWTRAGRHGHGCARLGFETGRRVLEENTPFGHHLAWLLSGRSYQKAHARERSSSLSEGHPREVGDCHQLRGRCGLWVWLLCHRLRGSLDLLGRLLDLLLLVLPLPLSWRALLLGCLLLEGL